MERIVLILYKLTNNGTLDTSFFNGGIGVIPVQSSSNPSKVQRLSDDSYIISGTGIRTMYAVKIDKFGILDNSFGTNGKIITPELSPVGYPAYNNSFELYGKSIVFLGMHSIVGNAQTVYSSVLRKYFFSNDSASKQTFTDVKINLFPNPVKDYVHFETDKNIKGVIIYDILGKVVLAEENFKTKTINIQKLKKGIYFINFFTNDGEEANLKSKQLIFYITICSVIMRNCSTS